MSSYRCTVCRQYFRGAPHRRINLSSFCSDACINALGRRQPDTDDVPTDVRAHVLERDRGRCRYCGTTFELHLHHVHYRSEGIDHSPANLITLCATHHGLIHSNKRYWQPLCENYVTGAENGRLTFLIDLARKANESPPAEPEDPHPTSDPAP